MATQDELNIANGMRRDGYSDEVIGQTLARYRQTHQQKQSIPDFIKALRAQGKAEQEINQLVSGSFGAPTGQETIKPAEKVKQAIVAPLKEAAGLGAGMVSGITEFGGNILQGVGKGIDYAANIPNKLAGKPDLNLLQKVTTPTGKWIAEKGKEILPATQDILEQVAGAPSYVAPKAKWVSKELLAPYMATAGASKFLIGEAEKIGGLKQMVSKPFLANSILTTEAQKVGSTGEMATPTELGIGAVIDLALGSIGMTLRKMAPELFRAGVNPKHTAKDSYDDVIKNATDAVENNYWGTAKGIRMQALENIKNSGEQLENLFKQFPDAKVNKKELTNGLLNIYRKILKGGDTAKANSVIKIGHEILNQMPQNMNYTQVLEVKREFAELLEKVFEKGAEANKNLPALKEVWLTVWKNADDVLGGVSPEVAKLNKDMTLAYSLFNPLDAQLRTGLNLNFNSILKNIPFETIATTGTSSLLNKLGKLMPAQITKIGARKGAQSLFDFITRRK